MYKVDKNTVALLHFEENLKDETGKTWNIRGAAKTSTEKSKFGQQALFLEKEGTAIFTKSPLLDVHKSPFTIEMWIYPTQYTTTIGNQWAVLAGMTGFKDPYLGSLLALFKDDGSGRILLDGSTLSKEGVKLNAWSHIAVSFDGTQLYYFINGKIVGKSTKLKKADDLGDLVIGATAGGWTYQFYGYIDEVRISNIARWTDDFNCEDTQSETNTIKLLAVGGDSQVNLSWGRVDTAENYTVKRAFTMGGPYTTIANNVKAGQYNDVDVTNGTKYYYIVTTTGSTGAEIVSNEAEATPMQSNSTKPHEGALLRIIMSDSSEREYRLNTEAMMNFVKWYTQDSAGKNNSCYVFSDVIDGSQEYLAFARIISFKVYA